jgi:5-methyltetrahydropteroyltriglutamate--homocysteine methyltransferase
MVQLPPVATTTVGSFPRPGWLAERNRSEVTFRLQGAELREAQDDATLIVLREQERLGLDLVTDGEQRRAQFIFHVLEHMDGFDVIDRRSKAIRRRTTHERMVPRVAAPIRRREPAVVEDLRFAKAHTSLPVKISVPGPVTVVDSTYDDFYRDEAAMAMDVASVLNAELLDLQAAGADLLQIDEPAMTRFPEKVAAFGRRALDRCLEGLTVPTIVHLCYGYPGGEALQHEYGYPELLHLLMESRIGGFSLEFARSRFDAKILHICSGRLVMFGCIDPGDAPPEPVEAVNRRVRKALDYVEPAHLLLAPD